MAGPLGGYAGTTEPLISRMAKPQAQRHDPRALAGVPEPDVHEPEEHADRAPEPDAERRGGGALQQREGEHRGEPAEEQHARRCGPPRSSA